MRLAEYKDFLKEKKEGLLYLITGNEPVLIDRVEESFKKEILGAVPEAGEFNFSILQGGSASASQVISEAQQISLLAQKRLIFVKEADEFSKEDQEQLAEYCAAPVPSAVLVFIAPSLDKRTRFYKALAQHGKVVDCSSPPPEDLREWAGQRCRKEGKEISPEAVELLVAGAGNSLTHLAQELEKLLLFCRDFQKIGEKEVEQISSKNRMKTVFNLWDAVAGRKRDEAYSILRELQQDGIAVPELVGLLRWQLSRLWGGIDLLKSGRDSKKDFSSGLGIPFYFVDKFIAQVKQFGDERMSRAYETILRADEDVKSGVLKDDVVFDAMLYQLMK